MRVLFINQVFYPDHAATAQHAHDLAKHLIAHGHEVDVIASRSLYGDSGATLARHEVVDGAHVHRVGKSLFGKSSIAARALDFGLFYLAASVQAMRVRKPDVVVCFTTPPFISLLGVVLRWFRGAKAVYWLMDMYPDVAVATGVMRRTSIATRFFERLSRWSLKHSDRVVVLGRCMGERVKEKGVDHGQVVRIGVWSDQDEVRPIPRDANPYRETWGLGDRFAVMYSGNFGIGHDVDTFLRAAELLKDDDTIRFVFVGGGKKKAVVEDFVRDKGLGNCVLDDYQPREKLDQSLSVADVHLVSILEGVEGTIVPCKLFGIMAAGRATAYIGSPTSEIARVLAEHDAGVLIEQGDAEGLAQAIRGMRDDRAEAERMGENARRALGEVYSREGACEAWRKMLEELCAPAGARGAGVAQ